MDREIFNKVTGFFIVADCNIGNSELLGFYCRRTTLWDHSMTLEPHSFQTQNDSECLHVSHDRKHFFMKITFLKWNVSRCLEKILSIIFPAHQCYSTLLLSQARHPHIIRNWAPTLDANVMEKGGLFWDGAWSMDFEKTSMERVVLWAHGIKRGYPVSYEVRVPGSQDRRDLNWILVYIRDVPRSDSRVEDQANFLSITPRQ